jgi:hypothetical protein
MGMFLFQVSFGTTHGAITFAVGTGTAISSILGRRYWLELSLSLFEVYASHFLPPPWNIILPK